jgi:hypothetical protein
MITDFNKPSTIISFILFALLSLIGVVWMHFSQSQLLEEYPVIEVNDAVTGRVRDKEVSKSIVRVILVDSRKFTIPASENYNYSPSALNVFLKENDIIDKKAGTDTLLITRDAQVFLFRLRNYDAY